ncbi:type II toxin-antitoxin system HipA family toxin [Demequina sediminicola]|uniref:type II toxin-antitoxin system HipA family toxin n=1 Tax=Demequina sediminicola TaxID=1095026 RepID=UPI0007819D1A|nr:type II toxin-antitoxin system HipA family toxin [Demequina sediminicola]
MTTIETLIEIDGRTRLVGRADFTRSRGTVSTTFRYDSGYLSDRNGVNVDPVLQLVEGAQHVSGLLPAFADTAPDRWGRGLVDKAERARALEQNRRPRAMDDVDYLLAVSDNTRQGALRFRLPGGSSFVGEDSVVPKRVALPHLLHASDQVTANAVPAAAVKELLDTGTTGLGGARPKASVLLADESLAIAKLPHASDRWDVMAWEAAALELLSKAGVAVPPHRLVRVSDRSVLLVRRFDRGPAGHRLPYVSAMTATGSRDGDQRDYVDILDAMRDMSTRPRQQAASLYDRIVGSVALGNTDDHLRNHGFISDGVRWRLSPVFDVNPNPDLAKARSTSIAGASTIGDEAEGLLALAGDAGLTLDHARQRIAEIVNTLSDWRDVAQGHQIASREVTMMAEAIEPRLEKLSALG